MTQKPQATLTRRAALSRLGMAATATYLAPSLTTLSVAEASNRGRDSRSSGSSGSSGSSVSSVSSASSGSSSSSGSSRSSGSSGGSLPSLPSKSGMTDAQKDAARACRRNSSDIDEYRRCLDAAGIDSSFL